MVRLFFCEKMDILQFRNNMGILKLQEITSFKNLNIYNLMETEEILIQGHLVLHDVVDRVILKGSRGILGGCTSFSDIDIGLIIDTDKPILNDLCNQILLESLSNWQGNIKLDLSIIFDDRACGLKCFGVDNFTLNLCHSGRACSGVYRAKTQFDAQKEFVMQELYPIMTIWDSSEIPMKDIINR